MSKEAMKLALGKIKSARDCHANAVDTLLFEAEEVLEEALAEQPAQQEPVALGYMNAGHVHEMQQGRLPYGYVYPKGGAGANVAIYTSPPAQHQEPVFRFQMQLQPGWGNQYPTPCVIGDPDLRSLFGKIGDVVTFYTSLPAQRKPLTDKEIWQLVDGTNGSVTAFARAIEAKLKEKNNA